MSKFTELIKARKAMPPNKSAGPTAGSFLPFSPRTSGRTGTPHTDIPLL